MLHVKPNKDGKKVKPMTLVLHLETWKENLVVLINETDKSAAKNLKKAKCPDWVIKGITEDWEKIWGDKRTQGMCVQYRGGGHESYYIRLQGMVWTLTGLATLLHEVTHYVQFMAKSRSFEDETEARAYMTEYVWYEVARLLKT